MKTIDLIHIEKSDVRLEVTVFPDGEPHVKFLEDIGRKDEYVVKCRICSPNDLFIFAQVGDILKRQEVNFYVDIYYLMSMRMDRVISFGEAFTLKMVAEVINNAGPKEVRIFHCHSSRAFQLIHNSVDLEEHYGNHAHPLTYGIVTYCYPDKGAKERYCSHRDDFDETVIFLEKKRDLNNKGAIMSIDVIAEPKYVQDTIMVVDDLCDAGGTFCWSAKILREKYPEAKLSIFVRHLVNPVGLKNLSENYDNVYITNSYKDWDVSEYKNVTRIDVA